MLDLLRHPWPWYVAGPLIGLTVPALLLLGNRTFGLSSNLRHICAACIPAGKPFFEYDWKREGSWNLAFVVGIILGSVLASQALASPEPFRIADATRAHLASLGLSDVSGLMPGELFGTAHMLSPSGLIFLVAGGFLVGFGTRWAGGCTSGHTIMGLSNLQWPSLVATVCFMVGGAIGTWLVLPTILPMLLRAR